jgi:hypothetical protein
MRSAGGGEAEDVAMIAENRMVERRAAEFLIV